MGIRITQVDSFTNRPFTGNPAGVCILAEPASETWMQDVAREMNLSETAFLVRRADGFQLRWFTPACEVDLCGHATLASAHVLWEEGHLQLHEQARFHSPSGWLGAKRSGEWIELDFPSEPPAPAEAPPELSAGLKVTYKFLGKNRLDYIMELEDEEAVRRIHPDFGILKNLGAPGVMVTARSSRDEFDFVSRYFAPGAGIDEDPVTGSAHCCLGPYWQPILGKKEMIAFQASSRGGIVRVRPEGNRVYLGGQAVTVLRGELL